MPRTNRIVLYVDIDGERVPLYLNRLQKAMNKVGKRIVANARKVLKRQNKVVSGNLSRSLFYSIEGSKDTIELSFEGHENDNHTQLIKEVVIEAIKIGDRS